MLVSNEVSANDYYIILKLIFQFNPFVSNAPSLFPLKGFIFTVTSSNWESHDFIVSTK